MRRFPMGLGQEIPTGNPLAATCWSEQLNEQLIAACKAKSPACTMDNMARLLELPYCPGSGPQTTPATVPGAPKTCPPVQGYSMTTVAVMGLMGAAFGYYIATQNQPEDPRAAGMRRMA